MVVVSAERAMPNGFEWKPENVTSNGNTKPICKNNMQHLDVDAYKIVRQLALRWFEGIYEIQFLIPKAMPKVK